MLRAALFAVATAASLCGLALAVPPPARPTTPVTKPATPVTRPMTPVTRPAAPSTAPAKARPGTLRSPRVIDFPVDKGSSVGNLQFTPDGRQLLWVQDKVLHFWDLAEGRLARKFGTAHPVYAPCLSADLKTVAFIGRVVKRGTADEQFIKVYDLASGRELCHLAKPPRDPADKRISYFNICGFDRTASRLYTSAEDDLQAWDLKTGTMLKRIEFGKDFWAGGSMVRSPGGRYFVVRGYRVDTTARAMAHERPTSLECLHLFDTDTDTYIPLKIDDAILGRALGFATDAQLVKGFRDRGYEVQWTIDRLSFSADDGRIYGTDNRMTLLPAWSLPDGKMIDAVRIPWIYDAHVSSDASRVVVRPAGVDERRPKLRMYDLKTQKLLTTIGPLAEDLWETAASPDLRWVAVTEPGVLRLYDFGPPPPAPGARAATRPAKP